MKPVSIALVSDAVPPFNKGGKETRIYYLTQELVRLGYNVEVYTMKWWKTGNTYQHEGVTYRPISRHYGLYAGDRRSIKQAVLFGIACLKMLRYNFDILEVDHMPLFPLFASKLVCMIKRKPLYATWHEVWGREYWQNYIGSRFMGTIAYFIERLSVQLPDHILSVSEHTSQQLRERLHYTGPISLIKNGIDYERISNIPASRDTSDLIYAGRLMPHKHVDLMIQAIDKVRLSRPNVTCRIIGDGPEMERLQNLVKTLGLQKNVRFDGFLESADDMLAAMKASRVFVLPSSREGFGITVLEAYACGLRVITADCTDNAARFLINPRAGAAVPLNVEALSEAIEHQLKLRPQAAAAKAAAISYGWKRSAQQLGEVYAV
jgi:glycosyltransferase involved in cell wall biosynthesis